MSIETVRFVSLRVVIFYATEFVRIVLARAVSSQHDGLIADKSGGAVYQVGINPTELEVDLGPDYEEGARLSHCVQPSEIHVATIHHVERPGFHWQNVEGVDLVQLAVVDCQIKLTSIC